MQLYFQQLPLELQEILFLHLDLNTLLKCEALPWIRRFEWWKKRSKYYHNDYFFHYYGHSDHLVLDYLYCLVVKSVQNGFFPASYSYQTYYRHPIDVRDEVDRFVITLLDRFKAHDDKIKSKPNNPMKYFIIGSDTLKNVICPDHTDPLYKNRLCKSTNAAGAYLSLYKLIKIERFRTLVAYVMSDFCNKPRGEHPKYTALHQIASFMIENIDDFMPEIELIPE